MTSIFDNHELSPQQRGMAAEYLKMIDERFHMYSKQIIKGVRVSIVGERQSGKTTMALHLAGSPFWEISSPSRVTSYVHSVHALSTGRSAEIILSDSPEQFMLDELGADTVIMTVSAQSPAGVRLLREKIVGKLGINQLIYILVSKIDVASKENALETLRRAEELLKELQQNHSALLITANLLEDQSALATTILTCSVLNKQFYKRLNQYMSLEQQLKRMSDDMQTSMLRQINKVATARFGFLPLEDVTKQTTLKDMKKQVQNARLQQRAEESSPGSEESYESEEAEEESDESEPPLSEVYEQQLASQEEIRARIRAQREQMLTATAQAAMDPDAMRDALHRQPITQIPENNPFVFGANQAGQQGVSPFVPRTSFEQAPPQPAVQPQANAPAEKPKIGPRYPGAPPRQDEQPRLVPPQEEANTGYAAPTFAAYEPVKPNPFAAPPEQFQPQFASYQAESQPLPFGTSVDLHFTPEDIARFNSLQARKIERPAAKNRHEKCKEEEADIERQMKGVFRVKKIPDAPKEPELKEPEFRSGLQYSGRSITLQTSLPSGMTVEQLRQEQSTNINLQRQYQLKLRLSQQDAQCLAYQNAFNPASLNALQFAAHSLSQAEGLDVMVLCTTEQSLKTAEDFAQKNGFQLLGQFAPGTIKYSKPKRLVVMDLIFDAAAVEEAVLNQIPVIGFVSDSITHYAPQDGVISIRVRGGQLELVLKLVARLAGGDQSPLWQ